MSKAGNTERSAEMLAKEIARQAISGQTPLLLACRKIYPMIKDSLSLSREIIDVFNAISSECDELPLGEEREHWSPSALSVKDREIEEYAEQVRPSLIEAMKELVRN